MELDPLFENQFYLAIERLFPGNALLLQASRENLIICVPQSNSIDGEIRKSDIFNHVLKEISDGVFETLNKKRVRIAENMIRTLQGFEKNKSVAIIKTENVKIKDHDDSLSDSMVRFYIIESPLFGGLEAPASPETMTRTQIMEYMSLLYSMPEHVHVFSTIDAFQRKLERGIAQKRIQSAQDVRKDVLAFCDSLEPMLRCKCVITHVTGERVNPHEPFMRQSVRSYVFFVLHNSLYHLSQADTENKSANFRLGMSRLRRKESSFFLIPEAKSAELVGLQDKAARFHEAITPLEKVQFLTSLYLLILDVIQRMSSDSGVESPGLSLEKKVYILTYVITRNQVVFSNLISDLHFISLFHDEGNNDERSQILCHYDYCSQLISYYAQHMPNAGSIEEDISPSAPEALQSLIESSDAPRTPERPRAASFSPGRGDDHDREAIEEDLLRTNISTRQKFVYLRWTDRWGTRGGHARSTESFSRDSASHSPEP